MKFTPIAIVIAMLAACANSPAYLREHGDRYEFSMRQPPSAAASCVARNVENAGGLFGHLDTTIRDAATSGSVELVIHTPDTFLMTAEFTPYGKGSKAAAWFSPGIYNSEKLRSQFNGC